MKKFRFPLRSVQTVRNIRELRAREVFSAALAAHRKSLEAEQAARDRLAELQRILSNERAGSFFPAEHVTYMNALQVSTCQLRDASEAVVLAAKHMDECREAWIATRMDVRVIENLETKARQEYLREGEREAQSAMDDRTNALFGRAPLMTP